MRNCIRNKLHTHYARKSEFAIDYLHNSNKKQIECTYTCEDMNIAKIRNIVIRNKFNRPYTREKYSAHKCTYIVIRNKLHTHYARKGEFAIDFSHNSNKYQSGMLRL